MSLLHLVRHGRVDDAVLDGRDDPPLAELGRRQAEALAGAISGDYLVSSPLRRARETAHSVSLATKLDVEVVPAVGEVLPPELDADGRSAFLGAFMVGLWSEQVPELLAWREALLESLRKLAQWGEEVIVITHFVAINAAVGAATGDDRTTIFRPDNTSITTLSVDGERFDVVELGAAAHLDGLG